MAAEVETSSLDDFFAKKDKSKKKKSKVLSDLNALSQPEEKPKKKKSKEKSATATSDGGKNLKNASASSSSTENREKADNELEGSDEWVEIEEKVDADYTGLKIQSLRLEEREAAAREENGGGEEDDASMNGGAGNDGPWKKIEVAPVIEKDTTEVVSESKESTPTGTGKYVPPSVRAAQRQAAQQATAPLRKRNNKLAPDVNDQESFPTLGGGSSGISGGGGGRRNPADSSADTPKSYTSLHLQNKWDSLSRGSSEP